MKKIFARADALALRLLVRLARHSRRQPLHQGGRTQAVALLMTLWVVVVLSMIASSLAFDVQVSSKLALLGQEQFLAYNLAKSGVAVGMTHLQNDLIVDHVENPNQGYDSFADVWAQPGVRDKDREVVMDKKHKDRTYEVVVTDEESKIPLNQANVKVLKAMMEYYGFEAPDSDDMAAAIIDYRDQDDLSAASPGEKENEFYSAEMGQRVTDDMPLDSFVYRCPNEQFLSVDQLLDVYGISQFPELFYGYDMEEKQEQQQKLREGAAEGRKVRLPRERRRRGKGPLPIKDILTVSTTGNGRVNLNTASVEVLTILVHAATNFASIETAKATAESIADFRGDGRKSKEPKAEDAFKSMADVGKVPGVDVNAINQLASLGVQPVFKSETFTITGIGRTRRAQRTIVATVERKLEVYNPDDARLASNKGRGVRSRGERRRRGDGGGKGKAEDNYTRIPAVRVVQWLE